MNIAMLSQTVMPLYKDSIPNSKPGKDEEKTEYGNGITIISKITRPTLTVFLPPKDIANGTAVVICPGGGYFINASSHEGNDVAKVFTAMGVAAFVLKYRIPDDASDRMILESLCRRMIAFENHYLSIYKAYLLQQLQGEKREAVLFATKQLQEVVYPDQEVVNLLHAINDEHDAELQQAKKQALQVIEHMQR